jgi:hypothetical protein
MFLVRLIYASTVADTFKPTDIECILTTARKKNKQHGLTGMLCFNSRYFLQCLEGSRSAYMCPTLQRALRKMRFSF